MANTKYTHAIVSRVPEVFAIDKRVRVFFLFLSLIANYRLIDKLSWHVDDAYTINAVIIFSQSCFCVLLCID